MTKGMHHRQWIPMFQPLHIFTSFLTSQTPLTVFSLCADTRLPITLPILHTLVDSAESFSCSSYTKVQFRAMCSLAFYALLRVGELTARNKGACPPIQLCQLTQLVDSTGKIVSLKLTFADYIHNYHRHPFSIIINRQPSHCPVESLLLYLNHRDPMPGPLFIEDNPSPVISLLNSFRGLWNLAVLTSYDIKVTVFVLVLPLMLQTGLSDSQIRTLGRWQSNTFTKYVRIPSLST